MKEEKFPNSRNPLTSGSVRSFGISEGNITGRENTHTHNGHLSTTASGEVAQTLAFTTSQQGLNRDVGCMLRVRMGTECPEDNLRELT